MDKLILPISKLYLQYGIKSITMDDVAKHLGISKKTLYQYVNNKEELIEQFLIHQLNLIKEWVEKGDKEGKNAIDRILIISRNVSSFYQKIHPSISYDLNKYYPELNNKHIAEETEFIYEKVYKNLKDGIKEKIYREELNIELIARLYIRKLEDILSPDFLLTTQYPIEKIFGVMFENHVRGISNKKGIDYYEKEKEKLNFEITAK